MSHGACSGSDRWRLPIRLGFKKRVCVCHSSCFHPLLRFCLSDDTRWQKQHQSCPLSSSSSVSIPTAAPTSSPSLGVMAPLICSDRVQCCIRLAPVSRHGVSLSFLQSYLRAFAVGDGGTGKTTFVKVRRFSPLARPSNPQCDLGMHVLMVSNSAI